MGVLKARTRQVSFRVSNQEYETLRNYCISIGARSVSDVARSAVCRLTAPAREQVDESLQLHIRHLYSNFRTLSDQLEHISRLLEHGGMNA